MYNGHLSIEEIEQLIQQKGPAENQTHVESCQQCRSMLEDCQAVCAKLEKLASVPIGAERAMKCPDERIWFDVAAGTLPAEESLQHIQHAAECSSCGQRLKTATRMFEEELSPEEEQALAQLPSTAANAQRKLADDLAATKKENIRKQTDTITQKRAGFTSWGWFNWAAGAAGLAVVVFSSLALYRQHEIHQAEDKLRQIEQTVAKAYTTGRPMEYRVAGVPFGPVQPEERGGSSVLHSIEVPQGDKVPLLAAQAALLKRDSASAITTLESAQRSGNNSLPILDNLVVAYAMEGDRTGSKTDYETAIQLSEKIIKLDVSDSTVYFNRALIFERRGSADDATKAAKALQQFLQLERDPDWRNAAKQKMP